MGHKALVLAQRATRHAFVGFALPLLYDFCEFFGIQYVLGIPANCVFGAPRRAPTEKTEAPLSSDGTPA